MYAADNEKIAKYCDSKMCMIKLIYRTIKDSRNRLKEVGRNRNFYLLLVLDSVLQCKPDTDPLVFIESLNDSNETASKAKCV